MKWRSRRCGLEVGGVDAQTQSGPGREMDEERSFSFPELSGDFGGDHLGLRSQKNPPTVTSRDIFIVRM